MILTKEKIIEYINEGKIGISPFDKESVGAASYDLTLDNVFRVQIADKVMDAKESTNLDEYTNKIIVDDFYELKPGELVLGLTKEIITLPGNIVGILQGRSTFARMGLMVHVTANLVQPGVKNKQVLEIYNASNRIIRVFPEVKICQIVFETCLGNAFYVGKYSKQNDV